MKSYNKRFVCVLSMQGVTIDVVLLGREKTYQFTMVRKHP